MVARVSRRLRTVSGSSPLAFGTDAGIFAQEGLPGVVLGPGSITQAHTDREYVEVSQVETAVEIFVSLGLLLYIVTGLSSLFYGGNFLEYKVLGADAVAGEHLGILLIELGVGITVAAVMINTYVHFSSRARA